MSYLKSYLYGMYKIDYEGSEGVNDDINFEAYAIFLDFCIKSVTRIGLPETFHSNRTIVHRH